jgi:hypothetical protein
MTSVASDLLGRRQYCAVRALRSVIKLRRTAKVFLLGLFRGLEADQKLNSKTPDQKRKYASEVKDLLCHLNNSGIHPCGVDAVRV